VDAAEATRAPDLFDLVAPGPKPDEKLERAIDAVRARFGDGAIAKGRGLARATAPGPGGRAAARSGNGGRKA
jgi:hypothetical protein